MSPAFPDIFSLLFSAVQTAGFACRLFVQLVIQTHIILSIFETLIIKIMRYGMMVSLLLVTVILNGFAYGQDVQPEFKKPGFYKVMESGSEADINSQLTILKVSSIADKEAFEGALLMKKAGMAAGARKKLNLFKEGHKKLEAVLNKDSSNVEFRFLRLMIQEHAPGILGYKKELGRDSRYIQEHFKKLSPVVQQAVVDYSKQSKVLKPVHF
jgi:hypothetical protein